MRQRKRPFLFILLLIIITLSLFSLLFFFSHFIYRQPVDHSDLTMCSNVVLLQSSTSSSSSPSYIVPVVQVFDSMPFMFFRNAGRACPHYVYPSLLQSLRTNPCVIVVGNEACRSAVQQIATEMEIQHEKKRKQPQKMSTTAANSDDHGANVSSGGRDDIPLGHEIHFHSIRNVLYVNAIDRLYNKFPHHWFAYYKRYYEFLCFVRFYVLDAMMDKFALRHVFYQDSDSLLFVNVGEMVQTIEQNRAMTTTTSSSTVANTLPNEYTAEYMLQRQKQYSSVELSSYEHSSIPTPERTAMNPLDVGLTTDRSAFTSGHFSLFSRHGLQDSISFLEEFFTGHSLTNMDNFSDMTAFNLFIFSSIPRSLRWCQYYLQFQFRCGEHERWVQPPLTYRRKSQVMSLTYPPIVLSDDMSGFFDMNYVSGDVHWKDGVPYKNGTSLRYFAIHFQGDKKWYIDRYVHLPACSRGRQCVCDGVSCERCRSCQSWH